MTGYKKLNRRQRQVITRFISHRPILLGVIIFLFIQSAVFASNTWSPVTELNQNRIHHSSTTLNNDQVLVVGGISGTSIVSSTEIYNANTNQWQNSTNMSTGRQDHIAARLNDGRVLIAGGTGNGGDLSSAEIFDPSNASWTNVASMSIPRTAALVTKLSNGNILVSSGFNNGSALATAEIYNPTTNSWTSTGAMVSDATHAREALLLQDGRVFIIGLEGWTNALPPASYDPPETPTRMPQIYNPANNAWSTAAPRNVQQRWGTAVVMTDGRVLSTGGERFFHYGWGYPAFTCAINSEIYDPTTNTWSTTGIMLNYQGASASTVLPDGTILAFGSCSEIGFWRSHQYDPVSEYWSLTGGLNYNHYYGATSTLSDGRVLVSGGNPTPNSAEIFLPSGNPPPLPPKLHITDLDGGASTAAVIEGFWRPFVTASVQDENGAPGEAATVLGYWSYDPSTIVGCTTNNTSAKCTETADYIGLDVQNVSFTVTDILKAGHQYDATENNDPDGDSNGTSISIDIPDEPPAPPPPPTPNMYVSDLDARAETDGKRHWIAKVAIRVKDHNPKKIT